MTRQNTITPSELNAFRAGLKVASLLTTGAWCGAWAAWRSPLLQPLALLVVMVSLGGLVWVYTKEPPSPEPVPLRRRRP